MFLLLNAAVTKLGRKQRKKGVKLEDLTDFVRPISTGSVSKKEKMVLWSINKLKPIGHFVVIILKAFPCILDKGHQVSLHVKEAVLFLTLLQLSEGSWAPA